MDRRGGACQSSGGVIEGEPIVWALRWYCRMGLVIDLEQMMGERSVPVDDSTIYRWLQKFAPEIEKRLRWRWRRSQSTSWRVDETYVKGRGEWAYLYRALDKQGTRSATYGIANFRTESRRQVSWKNGASTGQVSEQCCRSRSWQAKTTDPSSARLQDTEDCLCDHHRN